jgi:predicted nucleic acid-binding protein
VKAYLDSSVLVALYVNEARSPRARAEARKHLPIPWTPLHDLEVVNALRRLHGMKVLDSNELDGLMSHIDEDERLGRLERPVLEFGAVFQRAGALSAAHTSTTLARAPGILHVASAIEIGCSTIVSGDSRQLALAKQAGLRVVHVSE